MPICKDNTLTQVKLFEDAYTLTLVPICKDANTLIQVQLFEDAYTLTLVPIR